MVRITGGAAEFVFFRPGARAVYLAGDFNNWRVGELPMRRNRRGFWTARLMLPPGQYKFRYWADGRWYTDFAAFGVEPGPYAFDSIVRVACETPRKPALRRRAAPSRTGANVPAGRSVQPVGAVI